MIDVATKKWCGLSVNMTNQPPTDGAEKVPLLRLVWQRYQWLRTVAQHAMQSRGVEDGLRATHVTLLSQLPDVGTTGAELARRLGVRPPTVHQWVRELAELGVLEVIDVPGSRRERRIQLTAQGRHDRAAAFLALRCVEDMLEQRIGADAVSQLRTALLADWGTESDAIATLEPAPLAP
jgi:DNA-binding MarR family transcriptional regulator